MPVLLKKIGIGVLVFLTTTVLLLAPFSRLPSSPQHAMAEEPPATAAPAGQNNTPPATGTQANVETNNALAQQPPADPGKDMAEKIKNVSCDGWLDVSCGILRGVAFLISILRSLFGQLLLIALTVLEFTASVTLDGKMYGDESGFVTSAWAITRDIANMFFIFILLFISIATILRIPEYGAQTLLPRLIIVALLINFSLPLARIVIDVTNLLAVEFINGSGDFQQILGQALRPQDIVNVGILNGSGFFNFFNVLGQIIITGIMGSVLALFAALIIFISAMFLFVRYVALVLILILAPLAFALNILPQTKGLYQKWQRELFNYAFFAPLYFFFIWLTARVLASKAFSAASVNSRVTAINSGAAAGTNAGIFQNYAVLFTQFTVAILLLIASLVVSKSLGIYGANVAEKFVNRGVRTGIKWGLRKPFVSAPIALAGMVAKRGVASIRSSIGSGVVNTFRRYSEKAGFAPGREAAANMVVRQRKTVAALEESLGKYNSKVLEQKYNSAFTSREERAAITSILAKRGELKEGTKEKGTERMTHKSLLNDVRLMRRLGADVKAIEKYDPRLIERDIDGEKERAQNRIFRTNKTDDWANMAENIYTDESEEGQKLRKTIWENISKNQLQDIHQLGGKLAEALIGGVQEVYGEEANTVQALAKKVRDAGNTALAEFLESKDGEKVLRSYEKNRDLPSRLRLDLIENSAQLETLLGSLKKDDFKDMDIANLKKDKQFYEREFLPRFIPQLDGPKMRELWTLHNELYEDVWSKFTNNYKLRKQGDIVNHVQKTYKNERLADFFRSTSTQKLFGLDLE